MCHLQTYSWQFFVLIKQTSYDLSFSELQRCRQMDFGSSRLSQGSCFPIASLYAKLTGLWLLAILLANAIYFPVQVNKQDIIGHIVNFSNAGSLFLLPSDRARLAVSSCFYSLCKAKITSCSPIITLLAFTDMRVVAICSFNYHRKLWQIFPQMSNHFLKKLLKLVCY